MYFTVSFLQLCVPLRADSFKPNTAVLFLWVQPDIEGLCLAHSIKGIIQVYLP